MAKVGRPSLLTAALADKICDAVSTSHKSVDWLCAKHPEFPHPATVWRWQKDNDEFRENLARARERRADILVDQCVDIADESERDGVRADNGKETQHATEQVARSKLRVETRLKVAAMLAPKRYGDKLQLDGAFSIKTDVREMSDDELLRLAASK